MPGVIDDNSMMLKAKYIAQKGDCTRLEVEVQGNIHFITSFFKTFNESFYKNSFSKEN